MLSMCLCCGGFGRAAQLKLGPEKMQEHRPGGLDDALVVCQVKAGYGAWSTKVLDAELRGELVVPRSELLEDAVDSMDVEAVGPTRDTIDVGYCK